MNKKDLKNREDVKLLVCSFYDKIRTHEVLAPFFEKAITDWDAHIEKLTDFWEASLFLKTKFYGNPLQAHIEVDRNNNHSITQEHFGLWLNLWVNTVDTLYKGDYAENAKSKARKMASFMYINIFSARK
ncbi:group III truncated hemoglobin [Mangrovimonas spongiae]|uniref:Group III truncated hemoglobin n=1 Tax=Mangrovimonas spongiae TaxID=2494697 RepID=A0A3R9UUE8_9FLAO|nr:group III truncated hemoglobin [Mangrovimonas spongiae]RSK40375.1 group III truncated hemoglobin [Mangrovimonas spongiae]